MPSTKESFPKGRPRALVQAKLVGIGIFKRQKILPITRDLQQRLRLFEEIIHA